MTLKLTLASETGAVSLIEVNADSKISTLSLMVQAELSIEPAEQDLRFNGRALQPSATVAGSGLSDGDLVMVSRKTPATPVRARPASGARPTAGGRPASGGRSPSSSRGRMSSQDAAMLDSVLANESFMNAMRSANPRLYDSLRARDPSALRALQGILNAQMAGAAMHGAGGAEQQRFADPMSAGAQKAIEERIRMENVMQNMEAAMEHNPESFGSVVMLFVDCKVNSVAGVKAFVDSGAQATIISKECAQRCNILRLLDTRFAGTAHGVGSAKIHGRIHLALLALGSEVFEVSFTVMDAVGGSYDMLLGLDMLRKHQACIDLEGNCLRIGSTSVPFLAEKDIPNRMLGAGREGQQNAADPSAAAGSPRVPNSNAASVSGSASSRGSARISRSDVSRLVELGFAKAEAEEALRMCNGNADQAAAMLTSQKYGF